MTGGYGGGFGGRGGFGGFGGGFGFRGGYGGFGPPVAIPGPDRMRYLVADARKARIDAGYFLMLAKNRQQPWSPIPALSLDSKSILNYEVEALYEDIIRYPYAWPDIGMYSGVRIDGPPPGLTYSSPYFSNDWRIFSDLLSYAPGVNTSAADICATVENEAGDLTIRDGAIDPAARRLIDRARSFGWKTITIKPGGWQAPFAITFDGAGRFAWNRDLAEGLTEQVICDGQRLLHLYPDLGIGAKRAVSRFHRADFSTVAPFVLGPAEDMARGCDVALASANTVSLIPHGARELKDKDGKQLDFAAMQLVFDDSGRLAERRVVRMPSGKIIWRQTLSGDGTVKLRDGEGTELCSVDLALQDAPQPQLTADTAQLVVLPMPIRTVDHVRTTRNPQLDDASFEKWSENDALAMIAACMTMGGADTIEGIVARRFTSRGDRRIGFNVLSVACPWSRPTVDPAAAHPASPLANYLSDEIEVRFNSGTPKWIGDVTSEKFIARLAAYRHLLRSPNDGQISQERLIALSRTCKDPYFGWALLAKVMGSRNPALADVLARYEDIPGLAYCARYQRARMLLDHDRATARRLFIDLYSRTVRQGAIPPIDNEFRSAFDDNSVEEMCNLFRNSAAELGRRFGYSAAVQVARQCRTIGAAALAGELLTYAINTAPEDQKIDVSLAAVEYLAGTQQQAKAMKIIEPLLNREQLKDHPALWRLAGDLTWRWGYLPKALDYEEHALDLEFGNMSAVVDLSQVRRSCEEFLLHCGVLARCTANGSEAAQKLAKQVVRFADRWRAIDPDATSACRHAASVLHELGEADLAWEYLVTPLAQKPNEAQPWADLATTLRQQGDLDLADKAYATAFDREPTNAQLLWDRAELLTQTQRHAEARQCYRKLAEGNWQPRFANLKARAEQALGRARDGNN